MAVGDLYQLHFFINNSQTPTECVMGYKMLTGVFTFNTLEALCQQWIDDVQPSLLLCLSENALVSRVQVTTVTSHDEVPGLVDQVSKFGSIVSQALPPNMAALIHLPTDAPNAKHNGRLYLAGTPENGQEEGSLFAAQLALLQTFADELAKDITLDAPETGIFAPVVISRFLDGVKRVPPVGFLVGVAGPKTPMRQQRRRKAINFGYGS